MAELIPSLATCLPKMTSGEKRVARCLEALLDDDYLCWYDIPLGKHRRYPDFIVLHPSRGLLFLEVKDWKPEQLKRLNHKTVDLLLDSGLKTVAHPIEQARQYTYAALKLLEGDPRLISEAGRYKGALCFPYGYGVVFTNITRKALDKAIPEAYRDTLMPSHLILCKEDIVQTGDAEQLQTRLWGMFNYQFGSRLTLPQINRIRWHLFPEVRIDHAPQGGLFASEPVTGGESGVPEIIRIMDVNQEQLARSLGDGHRVIHGVAGSGKTLILGYRCLHLSKLLQKPILVLCFNITLAARLRAFISARGIEECVEVYHFHDWCGEQLKTFAVNLEQGKAPIWERQVNTVINAVARGEIPRAQYGALLIDEGHDFEAEWLRLVVQMLDPETNSMLLLYDDAQSIYRKHKGLNFSLASVGIQAQGRTKILKLNYRNSREILEFAFNMVRNYLDEDSGADIPLVLPEAAGVNGPPPQVMFSPNLQDEVLLCTRKVLEWIQDGIELSEIAVLYPLGEGGRHIHEALKKLQIPHAWFASSVYKKRYQPGANQIAVMPIPSSKGLEFKAVYILDCTATHEQDEASADLTDSAKRLYVGLTRARDRLAVSFHHNNALATALTRSVSAEAAGHPGFAGV